MSFDVFLQRFSPGTLDNESITRMRSVLHGTSHAGPDPFGFYIVTFPDSVQVEFSAKGLDGAAAFTSCAFHIHGTGPHLVAFIFEMAKAGDLVILAAMEDFVPILSRPEQRSTVPKGFPEPVLCESSAELEALLAGGYSGWRRFRDHVSKNA